MNKCRFQKELSSYIDNQLPEQDRRNLEEHIKTCSSCTQELKQLRLVQDAVRKWQAPEPGAFFEHAVKEEIAGGARERGATEMKTKTMTRWIPVGVLTSILLVAFAGLLLKSGYFNTALTRIALENKQAAATKTKEQEKTLTDKISLAAQAPILARTDLKSFVAKEERLGYDYEGTVTGGWDQYQQVGEFNTEQYNRIYDNEFLMAKDNPLSTFSIDVDTASYSNIRRFLNSNQLPPKDAVRIEEMINYFSYDYPQPKGDEPFSVTTEVAGCPWNKDHQLVLIGLQGKNVETANLPPSNLVFLIDVSGSMNTPNKLPLLKSAFKLLVDQLRPQDRISMVVYAGSSGLVLDSTSGDQKQVILQAIDNLKAGGSTAGGEGIKLAYEIAKKNLMKDGNNRIILATDGDFNVGISSDGELIRMIEEKRNDGIFLTVLGFGMGNYKDAKMEQLADKGNGTIAYIDNLLEAKKVFVSGLSGTLLTIAKDVKIQVEFNPTKIKAYRLIGYENRMLKKEDFNDDKKDAGEIGAGHSVTALYEVVLADSKEEFANVDDLKYQQVTTKPSKELMTVKLRYKEPDEDVSKLITKELSDTPVKAMSENMNFATAVAEFGLILRDSQYKGDSSYKDVMERAKTSIGKDTYGYRAEFIRLVEIAELLTGGTN
ncbi:MAG: von Willebrand factor type A domain-containing protein [Candidatus Omnitrophica bacterium]|nr:von Willebrand factor type A domain-containing protein [Candidatus Omnitrophota bacterium]